MYKHIQLEHQINTNDTQSSIFTHMHAVLAINIQHMHYAQLHIVAMLL